MYRSHGWQGPGLPSPARGRSRWLAGRSDPGRPPPDKGRAACTSSLRAERDTRRRASAWSVPPARSTGAPAGSEAGRAPPSGSIPAGRRATGLRGDRPLCGRPGPPRPSPGDEGGRCVAASLEGRHRALYGLTGPREPHRALRTWPGRRACVGPAQAQGSPLRDRVPTSQPRFPGRGPRPSPSRGDSALT
jgi:hypothetical protein